MIDPLGIFKEIKQVCDEIVPGLDIYVFGSRARGKSHTNKWDFDISISTSSIEVTTKVSRELIKHFNGRNDEFGKQIKVDVFRTLAKNLTEYQKSIKYAVLL